MSDTHIPLPPSSEALRLAYERFDAVVSDITQGAPRSHMPQGKSFESFFRKLRAEGDDTVFLCENPGP